MPEEERVTRGRGFRKHATLFVRSRVAARVCVAHFCELQGTYLGGPGCLVASLILRLASQHKSGVSLRCGACASGASSADDVVGYVGWRKIDRSLNFLVVFRPPTNFVHPPTASRRAIPAMRLSRLLQFVPRHVCPIGSPRGVIPGDSSCSAPDPHSADSRARPESQSPLRIRVHRDVATARHSTLR